MKLDNHIATRFLTDDKFLAEYLAEACPQIKQKDWQMTPEVAGTIEIMSRHNQKAFYVTDTVISLLDQLNIKKVGDHYDWKHLSEIPAGKYTFILPTNRCIRVLVAPNTINICDLSFKFEQGSDRYGKAFWVLFYTERATGELCSHFDHADVVRVEKFIYSLLCFIFLSENDYFEVKPGHRHGTRASGKIINSLPVPLTIINSRWNTTVCRTEAFGVRGHFALRWVGEGRKQSKMVFIEPYQKNGYTRKAANETVKS